MTMQRRVSWTEGARTVMTVHQMNPYEMFGFMIDSFLSAKDAETSSKVERLADALDNYITASTTNMTNGGDVFHECREFNDAQDVVFYDAIEPQSILAFTMHKTLSFRIHATFCGELVFGLGHLTSNALRLSGQLR